MFNYRNYPLLAQLFAELGVPVQKSDMSFGLTVDDGWLEYGTPKPWNIFAQKRNVLRPPYWRMMGDVLKFFREAPGYLDRGTDVTLGQCLDELKMGHWFRRFFLMPMGSAIWSCPPETMLAFPAATFVRFFKNHGLLSLNDQPQWYTVTGGSHEYVRRLTGAFSGRIVRSGAARVERSDRVAGGNCFVTAEDGARIDAASAAGVSGVDAPGVDAGPDALPSGVNENAGARAAALSAAVMCDASPGRLCGLRCATLTMFLKTS